MSTQNRRSLTFRELTRGMFFYQQRVPVSGFRWRDDLEPAAPREDTVGLPVEAFEPPWLVGPFHEGLMEPEASVLGDGRPGGKPGVQGEPGLHRAFAALWSSASIRRFANRYGHLLPVGEMVCLAPATDGPVQFGESLRQWQDEIATMRRLLHFWDLIQARNASELARYLTWHASDNLVVEWLYSAEGDALPFRPKAGVPVPGRGYHSEPLLVPGRTSALAGRFKLGDVIEPMRLVVHVEVNKMLRGVSPAVLPYAPEAHRISFIPDCLRSALYVLFALELAGETRTKVCRNETCPRPTRLFVPQTRRADFCSEECRKKWWDRHKRRRPKMKGHA
jgi:hypothetical protein